jgi:hypothetical protein
MKHLLTCLLLFFAGYSHATSWYVSPSGSNTTTGLSTSVPFRTLQYASQQTAPGDTVFAMNGTYTNSTPGTAVMTVWTSGTANAWITYRNMPGHSPAIQLTNNWSAISVDGEDYIIIDGFTVIGNNANVTLAQALAAQNDLGNPATSGNGISIAQQYGNPTQRCHHVIVRNCVVRDCGGGGIYTYQADHVSVLNNRVLNCGWYSPYGNSGISFYQNWNSDGGTGIKMRIEGNISAGNFNYIPFYAVGSITDGNGIIVDDGRNTQNSSTLGIYPGRTYVANNVCFANGARGIHVYESDHVTVVNNTTYHNCLSPVIADGEFTAYNSSDLTFRNNIALPTAGVPPMDQGSTTLLTVSHNLWGANSNLADPLDTNVLAGDPLFVLPSEDPAVADFHLLNGSGATDSGSNTDAPVIDKDGIARPLGSVDRGAYEYVSVVRVKLQALLDGPYDANAQLMRDDLRVAGLIPVNEPHTALGFTQVGSGASACNASVFTTTGTNAIVDWVLLELRDPNAPAQVLATRNALIQRDGDVVEMDGLSAVSFSVSAGNYFVALRHRNHLGVMRSTGSNLSSAITSVDLRSGTTSVYGTNARKVSGNNYLLWGGNTLRDGALKYTGSGNDRDPVLVRVGGNIPTNTVNGYWPEDVTMDGVVKYTGANNDRDPILVNVGGTVPTNTRAEQLP